jgi:hypothetical protein
VGDALAVDLKNLYIAPIQVEIRAVRVECVLHAFFQTKCWYH